MCLEEGIEMEGESRGGCVDNRCDDAEEESIIIVLGKTDLGFLSKMAGKKEVVMDDLGAEDCFIRDHLGWRWAAKCRVHV
ncbi:hypothetical protein HanIR_Chr17g0879201 [Helianthus annuus]|nr:hypothetical protein HanIR_Chr17g0879201 [Helianthus annuus]